MYALKRRGKRHDYFTSALPWPQKGPAVSLPLGTSAPVVGLNIPFNDATNGNNLVNVRNASGDLKQLVANGTLGLVLGRSTSSGTGQLIADLTTATAATINQLRQAFQVQRLYERDARGGTRYTEIIRSHFGVISPDQRLQRPEYLGGGSTPVNISPVAQTSATGSQPSPLVS